MYIHASDCSSIGTITKWAGECSGLYNHHVTKVEIKGSTAENIALAMVGHELSSITLWSHGCTDNTLPIASMYEQP